MKNKNILEDMTYYTSNPNEETQEQIVTDRRISINAE